MQNQQMGAVMPPQMQNSISSPAVSPQANPQLLGYNNDIFYQKEQEIGAQVQQVNGLLQKGAISQEQGQYLMANLAQRARNLNAAKMQYLQQGVATEQPAVIPQAAPPVQNPWTAFNQERPGFFDGDARTNVLNYIKDLDMDKDEIVRIAQLVEGLESSAVDKYLKQSKYEKSLNDENAAAKRKLMSYAQNASSDGIFDRIFTREDIGNMSGEEFDRNEKAIMEQMKQGLLK